jgi:hypothetical protein
MPIHFISIINKVPLKNHFFYILDMMLSSITKRREVESIGPSMVLMIYDNIILLCITYVFVKVIKVMS